MGVRIRVAKPGEEQRLKWIQREAWSPETSPAPPQSSKGSIFDGPVEAGNVLVADENGLAVGYSKLVPLATSYPDLADATAHVQQLHGFSVLPGYRGRGIGGTMLEAVRAESLRRGATRITLRVLDTNERAMRLYRTAGYEIEGRLRDEFRIGDGFVDDVLMALELPA
ncbi:Acetyltransferase (GNAT) family protein [Actinopolyspora lacussalsi subsp. righensis]|uniref:Acetyltransferase (GNAT) family protein n=1 Tax=Actinopolyspora righensis TaxID=995060 RepID=A0A1I7CED9_9ACTN|nr:GNAT family N-acetyltransferase [Actinopolyspora righensis]SFT97774.1 Acetyltransferase (GNAT) family protein [Actinopolyspora righensis]